MRRAAIVVGCVLAGLVAGGIWTLLQSDRYRADAGVLLKPADPAVKTLAESSLIASNVAQTLRTQAVEQALQTVERRVNALGVSEPIVAPYGTAGDQILVQLPGVKDPDQVKRLIGTTALLELLAIAPSRRRVFLHPEQDAVAYRPSYAGPAIVFGGRRAAELHRAPNGRLPPASHDHRR